MSADSSINEGDAVLFRGRRARVLALAPDCSAGHALIRYDGGPRATLAALGQLKPVPKSDAGQPIAAVPPGVAE